MELLLSRLAYECIKYAMDTTTSVDFLYADYCNREFEYNSDFNSQATIVWGKINTAIQNLFTYHKVSTFTKFYEVKQENNGLPYIVLDKEVGEVINVVDILSNGLYSNFSFRRNRVSTDNGVEDRITILNGIVGSKVCVEYYRQPKRFDENDIVAVTSTTDNNIDLSDYGLTLAGYDYIVNFVQAKIIELLDPVIAVNKTNEANNILSSIHQEPRFSQSQIQTYDGGI